MVGGPEGWGPRRVGRPKISNFFPSPATFSLFLSLSLAVSCETPAASGPPRLHTTTRELQTFTFESPGASNTTKIPREDSQRETKKNENEAGRGKKKELNFRFSHPSGPHLLGPSLFLGLAPHPSGPHRL